MDSPAQNKPRFQVQRYYVKEITCKVPHAPRLFIHPDLAKEGYQPTTNLEMQIKHQALLDYQHEVTLHMTAMVKCRVRSQRYR
jgi:preprotein translocase subunit SecB